MVSPRTPITKRYGPSTGGVGSFEGHGAGAENGKRILRVGLDVNSMHGFESFQNGGIRSESEWDGVVSDEVLVGRAREAFERARRGGHPTVEMEEREWDAWQKHVAIEMEIERRVAERLEVEKRRKVIVPISSRQLSTRSVPVTAAAPGILADNAFTPIGSSYTSRASSPSAPGSIRKSPNQDIRVSNASTKSLPLLSGTFPDVPETDISSPPGSPNRHHNQHPLALIPGLHTTDLSVRRSTSHDMLPSTVSAYSGNRAILSSRSEIDIVNYGNEMDICEASTGTTSDVIARRKKRAELRRQLDL
jgi:hypothetical protein